MPENLKGVFVALVMFSFMAVYLWILIFCVRKGKERHENLLKTHYVTYGPWGKTYTPKEMIHGQSRLSSMP